MALIKNLIYLVFCFFYNKIVVVIYFISYWKKKLCIEIDQKYIVY